MLRFAAMGTRVELHVFGDGDPRMLEAARRAIEAVDDALTIHRPSPATALNEALAGGGTAVVRDPVLLEALLAIDGCWRATGELFDPAVGSGGGWGGVAVGPSGVVTADTPVAFDFGGFGKGFALDRAAAVLRAAGVGCAFLSAGESSVAVIGEHPLGGGWPVAVPHPLRDGVLVELELRDASMSVSSTVGNDARSAMIRAADGAVVTQPATAIAVAASGGAAEAMSTALLVAPDDVAGRLTAQAPQDRFRFTFEGQG